MSSNRCSSLSSVRFANTGEIIPPCGVPSSVGYRFCRSIYPALSHFFRMVLSMGMWVKSHSWEMASNDLSTQYPLQEPGGRERKRGRGYGPAAPALWSPFSAHLDQFPSAWGWASIRRVPGLHGLAHSPGSDYTRCITATGFYQAHLRCCNRSVEGGRGLRGSMSTHPTQIWQRLPVELQERIRDDLSSIFQEVIYEHIRTDHSPTSAKEGGDLRPTIDTASGDHQSGKPAVAIRARAARPKPGLATRGYRSHRC